MNILFVCMVWPKPGFSNMYSDLMSEFVEEKHNVFVATLSEKRQRMKTGLNKENGINVLRVRCGNIQKVNKYRKVISSYLSGYYLRHNVKKYFKKTKIDLMIFALPPLTIAKKIIDIKKYFGCKLYLLLKEFWPQDPADLGAMKVNGLVWKYFKSLENLIYSKSDFIGTMSEAGIEYLKMNKHSSSSVLEVNPNCKKDNNYHPCDRYLINKIRNDYAIPLNKKVFVFGGNLGISQGIPEMILSISACENVDLAFFLIIGDGTEYDKVKDNLGHQKNVMVLKRLDEKEYDNVLSACDYGLIFLYPDYSVPNIPSRFISYIKYGMPVLACIDHATDLGKIISNNNCGYFVYSGDVMGFRENVIRLINDDTREMKDNCIDLFKSKYTSRICYDIIISHFKRS